MQVSGEAGRVWVDALPDLVDSSCTKWSLSIEGAPMTGELGLVLPVACAEGAAALKVAWPDEDSKDEAAALAAWSGRGAARLFAVDEEAGAMLLERADHTRSLRTVAVEQAVVIAGELLNSLAIEPLDGAPDVVTLLDGSAGRLRVTDSVPGDVVELALDCLGRYVPGPPRLINTDLHYENVLAAERLAWLVIDPKVANGDIEFGIAPLLWNLYGRVSDGSLLQHFHAIVGATGSDAEKARQLTIVRLADYWEWAVRTGLTEDPKMCAALIDRLRS